MSFGGNSSAHLRHRALPVCVSGGGGGGWRGCVQAVSALLLRRQVVGVWGVLCEHVYVWILCIYLDGRGCMCAAPACVISAALWPGLQCLQS